MRLDLSGLAQVAADLGLAGLAADATQPAPAFWARRARVRQVRTLLRDQTHATLLLAAGVIADEDELARAADAAARDAGEPALARIDGRLIVPSAPHPVASAWPFEPRTVPDPRPRSPLQANASPPSTPGPGVDGVALAEAVTTRLAAGCADRLPQPACDLIVDEALELELTRQHLVIAVALVPVRAWTLDPVRVARAEAVCAGLVSSWAFWHSPLGVGLATAMQAQIDAVVRELPMAPAAAQVARIPHAQDTVAGLVGRALAGGGPWLAGYLADLPARPGPSLWWGPRKIDAFTLGAHFESAPGP